MVTLYIDVLSLFWVVSLTLWTFKHIFRTQNEPFWNEILISENFERKFFWSFDVFNLFWVSFDDLILKMVVSMALITFLGCLFSVRPKNIFQNFLLTSCFWLLCILTYLVYFGSLLDKTRGQLRLNKNPNSSVLNLNGINVTLSQNLSHVSVSWKASLMQWSSSPSCRAQAQWFNVTCLLLWATGQIEINRLNAKTVLKIMIDNFWILNFKKLLWFSVLTYILRVP